MAAPTSLSDSSLPPHAAVKRSFTLPASFQQTSGKQNVRAKEAETQAIETLFAHPKARIIHFTTSGAAGLSSHYKPSARTNPSQDAPGTLQWKTSTERTLASGPFRIYRVPGSVAFLNAGTFLKPVLAKSQCWCVDGESTFVLKRGPTDYYRIELPYETDEDKTTTNDFQQALGHVLMYEKTPCPFQREFYVELPESPQVTYIPWKPKHRPISPERRQSVDSVFGTSPDGRARPLTPKASAASRSPSRHSSGSRDATFDQTLSSPAREYSPSPLRTATPPVSIRPRIGKFEDLDKDHEREKLARGRQRELEGSDNTNQKGPDIVHADFGTNSRGGLIEHRQSQIPVSARTSRMNRNVTAPAAVLIKELSRNGAGPIPSISSNGPVASSANLPDERSVTKSQVSNNEVLSIESPTSIGETIVEVLDPVEGEDDANGDDIEVRIPTQKQSNRESAFPLATTGQETGSPVQVDLSTSLSAPASQDLGFVPTTEAGNDLGPGAEKPEPEPESLLVDEGGEQDVTDSMLAQGNPHLSSDIAIDDSISSDALAVPESLKSAEEPSRDSTLPLALNSKVDEIGTDELIPEFGFDAREDEGPDLGDDAATALAANDVALQSPGIPQALERELLEEPDTPTWHSAAESTQNSSADSLTSGLTNLSFVTAPLAPHDVDELRTSSTEKTGHLARSASSGDPIASNNLLVPKHRRERSRSPLPMSTNLYLSRQDSYEHVGAVIGEKMAGVLLGPPLQIAAMMLRIASRFTNGVRIRDEEGKGWERRGEKGRRLPGMWESEDEGDLDSEWDDDGARRNEQEYGLG